MKRLNKEYALPIPLYGRYNVNLFRLVWRTGFVVTTTLISMLLPFFYNGVGLLGTVAFWPLTEYFPVTIYKIRYGGGLLGGLLCKY